MDRKKSRTKPTIKEDTSNLPCEVIYTILSKLPVKSLLRFRCVCKPWLALISEPQFIKLHLNEAVKSDRQRIIRSVFKSECFFSLDCETSGESEEEMYFPIKKYRKASVLCSCNGLVLLGVYSDKMYVLWNPSTRDYKRFLCPYAGNFLNPFYGICYDSSVDDYKVLMVYSNGNDSTYFMVYTCKTNLWTEIRDFPYWMSRDGVTIGGVPHWAVALKEGHELGDLQKMPDRRGGYINISLILSDNPFKACEAFSFNGTDHYRAVGNVQGPDHIPNAIVYFDLVDEKFKEVPLPNWIWAGDLFHLMVMRGCLCLVLVTSDWQQVDFWEMKEYGNRNSWTKVITIPSSVGSTCLCQLKPLYFTKQGEVVLTNDSKIVLYDPKENKMRNIKTFSIGMKRPFNKVVSYVDTLVSPALKSTKRLQFKHIENGKKMKEL